MKPVQIPNYQFIRQDRRWVLRGPRYVFAWNRRADAEAMIAAALDVAGGEVTEFENALRRWGVCKAYRIY